MALVSSLSVHLELVEHALRPIIHLANHNCLVEVGSILGFVAFIVFILEQVKLVFHINRYVLQRVLHSILKFV
jgi:hypothetical protein